MDGVEVSVDLETEARRQVLELLVAAFPGKRLIVVAGAMLAAQGYGEESRLSAGSSATLVVRRGEMRLCVRVAEPYEEGGKVGARAVMECARAARELAGGRALLIAPGGFDEEAAGEAERLQ